MSLKLCGNSSMSHGCSLSSGTQAVPPESVHSVSMFVLPSISLESNPPEANTPIGVANVKASVGGIGGGGGCGGRINKVSNLCASA